MMSIGTRSSMSADLREIASQLRERLTIRQVLEDRGVVLRAAGRSLRCLCPFHAEDRPSFHVSPSPNDGVERFRCFGCGIRGDVFDLIQSLENYPDYVSTLRALAERHQISWPTRLRADTTGTTRALDAATQYYARELTGPSVTYLAQRGFPEAFLKEHHVGYAAVHPGFGFTRFAEAQQLDHAAEAAGLIQKPTDTRPRRDYFLGRIIFPNREHGHTIDLQGRAFPTDRDPKYLNLPGSRRRMYRAAACAHAAVVLCEGIPDTLSVLLAGVPACGIYGSQGWTREYQPLFRRCRRVYVALDRDATDRAIAIAKDFGVRGRVLVPPQDLGQKGDLNDWLVGPAAEDPKQFKEILIRAMAQGPTPWALNVERLEDVPPWDQHEQLEGFLAELAPMPPVFRETHLELLHRKTGISFGTLLEAARDLEADAAARND
ncbi:MAG TPA: CHC2 zinc finger domain-containing protein [bacterium]|nr:CHC2 zinc finger domain-containing protein [bacterium]